MGKLIAIVLLLGGFAAAQQLVRVDPDCPVGGAGFMFSAAGQTGPGPTGFFDNRQAGCSNWTVTYSQVAAGALQIEIQGAENVGGAPGAWTTFVGGTVIVIQGANPSTTTPSGIIQVAGYKPFMRVLSDSQSANLVGFLFGARNSAAAGATPVTAPCPGTAATPCVVDGPDAPGAVSTKNPVQVAGFDGTDVRAIATDASGRSVVAPQAADGAAAGNSFPQGARDDASNMLSYHVGTDQADVTLSAGTDVKIVAGVAAKQVYVYHLSFSGDSSQAITIRQGTTVSTPCDTTTVVLAGPYQNLQGLALDFNPFDPLKTTVAASDVCLHFGGSVTTGGLVKYAQY